jgi:Na+/H+ antiporter NhaD and related arsenite permeases
MDKAFKFAKSHIMPIVAWLLAIVSVFFVPVDKNYLSYFDLRTLLCLFSTMLVIGAFKNIRIFIITASALVHKLKNTRALVIALVFITYFFSIFIANDMALLTFLPLTITVFRGIGKEKYIAITVILQNIAANLGGMIMPFGNPQSLYLYSYFNIPVSKYLSIMAIPFTVSLVIILAACLFVKKEDAILLENTAPALNKPRTAVYAAFAVIALLSVLRVGNYLISTAVIAVGIAALDYKAYKKVDYSLLLTFAAFFIFANNMARIDAIKNFVTALTAKNTLLTGVFFLSTDFQRPNGNLFE